MPTYCRYIHTYVPICRLLRLAAPCNTSCHRTSTVMESRIIYAQLHPASADPPLVPSPTEAIPSPRRQACFVKRRAQAEVDAGPRASCLQGDKKGISFGVDARMRCAALFVRRLRAVVWSSFCVSYGMLNDMFTTVHTYILTYIRMYLNAYVDMHVISPKVFSKTTMRLTHAKPLPPNRSSRILPLLHTHA